MYQYQTTSRYFAQIAHGLEEEGARELAALGAQDVQTAYRGLYFDADAATLYRVNYAARLPTQVLAPLLTFDCHSDRYLYKTARHIDWTDFLSPDDTFAVFANVSHSRITHSKFAALRLKDAVVDQFRERFGRRPSIDPHEPDVWIGLYVANNRAVVSIGTSGGSLHRRFYRTAGVEAPMQETVAAAVIRYTGWDGERPLYDPMCGSGTLLCEALMHYARIPAGYLRPRFGFERLPGFDAAAWRQVRAAQDARIRPVPDGLLGGSDRSPEAVDAARRNAANLPGGDHVAVSARDFRSLPPLTGHVVVCNPPYGLRLGRGEDLRAFYRAFGDFLKQRCTGSSAYVYFGKRELLKHIGLHPAWKKPLVSGALDGRLAKFDLY
jgi:putative N6-adenine-specific DNA methylase